MIFPARGAWALAVLLVAGGGPGAARVIEVGEGKPIRGLIEAVDKAQAGDTIRLGPGEYYECASIGVPDLTIEGVGPATVITDRTCAGKAILIGRADNLTLRDLVLARARVQDMNGAGVRMEARGFVAERVRFENDQVGILGGNNDEIRISDCVFEAGGVAGERPGNAVWIGNANRLVVERSRFLGVKGGQITSGAAVTELTGNRIETGIEPGAGHAVMILGGRLVMHDNTIVLGPNPPPRNAAVAVNGQGAVLDGNRMENNTGQPAALLLDWMHGTPILGNNTVPAGDTEATTSGVWRHRVGGVARAALGEAKSVVGAALGGAKGTIRSMLGR